MIESLSSKVCHRSFGFPPQSPHGLGGLSSIDLLVLLRSFPSGFGGFSSISKAKGFQPSTSALYRQLQLTRSAELAKREVVISGGRSRGHGA